MTDSTQQTESKQTLAQRIAQWLLEYQGDASEETAETYDFAAHQLINACRLNELLAALHGIDSFFKGEDGSDGIADIAGMADHEPVTVTLNVRTVRAVQEAIEKAGAS